MAKIKDGVRIDDRELKRVMRRGLRAVGDLSPWFRGTLDKGVTLFLRRHFDTRGSFGGTPWAPLKLSTIRNRLRRGGNRGGVGHPLWDFGDLRRSLLVPGSRNSLRVIRRDRYERGTSDPKARWHQDGTSRMPARVIIPEPPSFVVRAWEKSLARWIERQL